MNSEFIITLGVLTKCTFEGGPGHNSFYFSCSQWKNSCATLKLIWLNASEMLLCVDIILWHKTFPVKVVFTSNGKSQKLCSCCFIPRGNAVYSIVLIAFAVFILPNESNQNK